MTWMSLAAPGQYWGKDLALRREEKQWAKIPFVEVEGRINREAKKILEFTVLFVVVVSAVGLS